MANKELKHNVLGFWGVVFLSFTAIFPASIYLISSTTSLTFAGEAAPLTFVVGTILMLFDVAAVYIFSTKVSNAGGFYKYVQAGTNNGLISRTVAWDQFIGQMSPVIISSAVLGWLVSVSAKTLYNVILPFYLPFIITVLVIIFIFIVSYLGIKLSSKIAIVVGIMEVVFLLSAGIFVVMHTHYNSIQTFNIEKSSNGLSGFFIGMVTGPLTAYIGYSAVVHFSEEAKFSKSTMKHAILLAVLIAGAFETFMMYAITVGVPQSQLSSLAGTYAPALLVTAKYAGTLVAVIVLAVAFLGQLISPLIFGNSAQRILYSLSRDNVLPAYFSNIHPKYGSPSRAATFVLVFALIASFSTEIPLTYYYGVLTGFFYSVVIWATILTTTNLIYHFAVNETLPVFMKHIKEFNTIKHLIVPTIGSIFIIIIFYYTYVGLAYPFIFAGIFVILWIIFSFVASYLKKGVPLENADINVGKK